MPEHKRESDCPGCHSHRRLSDDILTEMLRIVQGIDTSVNNIGQKLDDHIDEEMKYINKMTSDLREYIESAFVDKDLKKHKLQHMPWLRKFLGLKDE